MNTNENCRDNHEQQESDKSGTTSRVVKYYENWKAGALKTEDTDRCQTFFDQGTEVFPGASQELAYRLCWLGVWLVETRRWYIEGVPLMLPP